MFAEPIRRPMWKVQNGAGARTQIPFRSVAVQACAPINNIGHFTN